MERLFTPWRLRYILSSQPEGCIFCEAPNAGDDASRLILARTRSNYVILNLYPYSNGHLMVVPFRHLATPAEATPEERGEMMELAVACQHALEQAYHPEGFNLGLNLGKSAGAGVSGHFHMHVVPRWQGDTNFMSVLAETRVVPEDLQQTYEKLKSYFNFKNLPRP
jgi:ATP adenylyltransferase